MTLFEAQDASDIVANAASGDVNIILGTSINEDLGDEIRVTVIATGIDPSKKKDVRGSRPARTSQQVNAPVQRPVLDLDQAQPVHEAEDNTFGNWDIRRDQNVRPKIEETQFDTIEKKDFETFNREEVKPNDDELNTPPFFRRKR